ncbi:ribonuclease III [Glaciecola petra]|uniref:Ribonuclease 3 n=1 Tax=Glaciecola petra TaxID=3075602 RepID=A0ABU2ZWK5_9ALTE|nr:ribonuclease III [Aestuariibacter sp. P117]MDT0595807.1 ribonuclease III [Aestuariibacter sp. P117]
MVKPFLHKSTTKLIKHIQYDFKNASLLEQALTHRSAAKMHNERLEFLGDAVLGLAIAERVYAKFPDLPEGKLTRMRANLVKGATLAEIARELSLGELIKLGPGELKSGGQRRDSILADAVEAILGAVYLDANLDAVYKVIDILFSERLKALDPNLQIKDNKTRLQEYLQSRQIDLPEYEVVNISGKDHSQTFTVECRIKKLALLQKGVGRSRRIAEQEAAKLILENL